jgi:hypothetical protein
VIDRPIGQRVSRAHRRCGGIFHGPDHRVNIMISDDRRPERRTEHLFLSKVQIGDLREESIFR